MYGPRLNLIGTDDGHGNQIDGALLLWALAGCESAFGKDCSPRFEPAYFTNGYYWRKSEQVRQVIALYGRDGACSYGPWQVLAINARRFSPQQMGADPVSACVAAVDFINSYVLGERQARNLFYIFDTYNSGNWRDANVPHEYIARGVRIYETHPMTLEAT